LRIAALMTVKRGGAGRGCGGADSWAKVDWLGRKVDWERCGPNMENDSMDELLCKYIYLWVIISNDLRVRTGV